MNLQANISLPVSGDLPHKTVTPKTPPSRLDVIWLLLTISLLAFFTNYILAGRVPALSHVLSILSSAGCGLAWLISRALFRANEEKPEWTYAVVGILFVTGVTLYLARVAGMERTGALGFMAELSGMIGSAMLLLPAFEAVDGFGKANPRERRFRLGFLLVYVAILAVVMTISMPAFAGIEYTVQATLCLTVLFGTTFAVHHRKHLIRARAAQRMAGDGASDEAARLTKRLKALIAEEKAYLNPDLKVSELARLLGTHPYKVTRCITGPLGFANFNQMINTYRVEEARRLLADPASASLSILSIAMESGFGSIGPFNRAFKSITGTTPQVFRKARLGELA